jgi:hypothetical protein
MFGQITRRMIVIHGAFDMRALIICLVLGFMLSEPGQAIGEATTSSKKAIVRIEQTLERAASESPHWHQRQESIQRDVQDIMFLLQQSLLSSENPRHDRAGKRYYAQEALVLLDRATTVGNFDPAIVEPVLALIRHLLTD